MSNPDKAAGPERCPHLDGFDPMLPEQVYDPGYWTARARNEAPVFYLPKYNEWVITRLEDCLEVATVEGVIEQFNCVLGVPRIGSHFTPPGTVRSYSGHWLMISLTTAWPTV